MKTISLAKTTALWTGLFFGFILCQPAQTDERVEYIHTDAFGTPIAVTDENGNVIERFEYEPYGLQVSGPVADGPGYTGHFEDASTGLTYMQQRYYDPGFGIFLSVDPVTAYGNPVGQFNPYRYANGNPYRYADPDGRNPLNFNFMPTQKNANPVALQAEVQGLAAQDLGQRVTDAANYPARQVVGNGVAAGAAGLSLIPPLAPVMAPLSAIVTVAVTADKANHEGLDANDGLGLVVTVIPAGKAMKALGASEASVTALKIDAAAIGVTAGAAGVATANENSEANIEKEITEEIEQ